MAINFRQLRSQVRPFKPEQKKGFIFLATEEQKKRGLFSIAAEGTRRHLMEILADMVREDDDFSEEFKI